MKRKFNLIACDKKELKRLMENKAFSIPEDKSRSPTSKRLSAYSGFSLLEVLVSISIIGIIGLLIFTTQNSSWRRVTSSNRANIAGQMIERQIEQLRMSVGTNPANFPPNDSSYTENGITISWVHTNAVRPTNGTTDLPHVKKYTFTTSWGSTSPGDSLIVTTYLARQF